MNSSSESIPTLVVVTGVGGAAGGAAAETTSFLLEESSVLAEVIVASAAVRFLVCGEIVAANERKGVLAGSQGSASCLLGVFPRVTAWKSVRGNGLREDEGGRLIGEAWTEGDTADRRQVRVERASGRRDVLGGR